jgi:hypothetical protein
MKNFLDRLLPHDVLGPISDTGTPPTPFDAAFPGDNTADDHPADALWPARSYPHPRRVGA